MDAPFPARAEMTGILDISHPNPYKRPSENQTSVKQGFVQDFQTASIQAAKPSFEIGLTNAAYSNNSPSPPSTSHPMLFKRIKPHRTAFYIFNNNLFYLILNRYLHQAE